MLAEHLDNAICSSTDLIVHKQAPHGRHHMEGITWQAPHGCHACTQ